MALRSGARGLSPRTWALQKGFWMLRGMLLRLRQPVWRGVQELRLLQRHLLPRLELDLLVRLHLS